MLPEQHMSQMPSRTALPLALPLKASWANSYGVFDKNVLAVIRQKLTERPHQFKNGDFHPVFLPCEQSDEYDEACYIRMNAKEQAGIMKHNLGRVISTVHDSIDIVFRAPALSLDRGASPEAERVSAESLVPSLHLWLRESYERSASRW